MAIVPVLAPGGVHFTSHCVPPKFCRDALVNAGGARKDTFTTSDALQPPEVTVSV